MSGPALSDLAADLTAALARIRATLDAAERVLAAEARREGDTLRGLAALGRSEADAALALAARLADIAD